MNLSSSKPLFSSKYLFLWLVLFCFNPFLSFGQRPIVIPPVFPEGNAQIRLTDLLNVSILNTPNATTKQSLQVIIAFNGGCSGVQNNIVGSLSVPALELDPSGQFSKAYAFGNNSMWSFKNGDFANWLQTTGYLPDGCYEICYVHTLLSEQIQTKACSQINIKSAGFFNLVAPYDGSTVNELFPIFSWTMSMSPGGNYAIKVVERYPGQSNFQALSANLPVFEQNNLIQSFIQFSPAARQLENCKTYVWQVRQKNGNNEIKASEIWEFKYNCPVISPEKKIAWNYNLLGSDYAAIPYAVVSDTLRFLYYQDYESTNDYKVTIESLTSSKKVPVKLKFNRPASVDFGSKLMTGENYCHVDLKSAGCIPGGEYLLSIKNQLNTQYLNFKYIKQNLNTDEDFGN